jgi:hypothetical protein
MAAKPMTTCWCPKCETFHQTRMTWIGRGVPRKFCRGCRGSDEVRSEITYPEPPMKIKTVECRKLLENHYVKFG